MTDDDTTKSFDRASLNSGLKYYELIIRSMEATLKANVYGDLVTWTAMLSQIWNWMRPFVEKPEEIDRALLDLHGRIHSYTLHGNRLPKEHVNFALKLKIIAVEQKIYEQVKYMLLPTSKGVSNDLDWSRLSAGL